MNLIGNRLFGPKSNNDNWPRSVASVRYDCGGKMTNVRNANLPHRIKHEAWLPLTRAAWGKLEPKEQQ